MPNKWLVLCKTPCLKHLFRFNPIFSFPLRKVTAIPVQQHILYWVIKKHKVMHNAVAVYLRKCCQKNDNLCPPFPHANNWVKVAVPIGEWSLAFGKLLYYLALFPSSHILEN